MRQDYFEGTIADITEDDMLVKIDFSYQRLIRYIGDEIRIEKNEIVGETDFDGFSQGDVIRVLYSGIDRRAKKIQHIYAIYLRSDLP